MSNIGRYKNKQIKEDWHYCHPCQLKRGGKVPKWGQLGITVTYGECSECKQQIELIPNSDYDWPKKGIKASVD